MKLTTVVEAKTRVCATLEEDGTFSLKAFAEAEYAPGKTTTAEVHITDPTQVDAVKAALHAALTGAAQILGGRLNKSIHTSAEVSARHGEI